MAYDPTGATPHSARDGVLAELLELVNTSENPDAHLFFTLLVNGSVVTGKLLPEKRWFELHADSLENDDIANLLRGTDAEMPSAEASTGPAAFLHLVDARIHIGGFSPVPSNEGVFFRVRLDDVNGWFFGALGDDDASEDLTQPSD